jgi:MFS family permease
MLSSWRYKLKLCLTYSVTNTVIINCLSDSSVLLLLLLLLLLLQVVGSVSSPFLLDAYLSRSGTRCPTHRLATWTCLIMGASCCAVVPLAKVLPALVITLVVAGSAQAAVEALTYIHIAKRLDRLQRNTAVHVSMAMYILAQTTGGAIGSLLGSALLQQPWVVQVAAQAAACGAAGLYGVALGVVNHRGWCCKDAFSQPVDHGMSDAAAPAADARSRHVQDRQ